MIRPVKTIEVQEALRLAFQDFSEAEQDARIAAALAQFHTNPRLFDGLLVQWDTTGIPEGLIWIVEMPGKTCVTGLPCVRNLEDPRLILSLLQAANRWLESSNCSLNQFVLSATQHHLWGSLLHHAQHPIEIWLDHMEVPARPYRPKSSPSADEETLHATPVADPESPAFLKLLGSTFTDSLDCPAVTGHQSYAEMVRGYMATGESGTQWWRVLENSQGPLGCCLLTTHPSRAQMEVVYIGVSPSARGKGVGRFALRETMGLARQIGMNSVTAVVDQANRPAQLMYRSLGFHRVETRVSQIRLLPPQKPAT